uniref:(+)-piperitol/(+)-sesamin synthase n=1 Tax=Scoparia dulcis TaxID=107240 RepID=A0A1W7HBU9_SCODU
METSLQYAILSLFLLVLAFKFLFRKNTQNLPPSPFPSLPLLGHLYLLKPPLHRTYHHLSQKLGPIFSLQFGTRSLVIISSPTLAEECFTKNDIILANRPRFIIGKYIGYNYTSLIGSAYGEHWRNLRRLTSIEVFSSTRLNRFTSTRQDEVKFLLKKLYNISHQEFVTVELRQMLTEVTFNNIMRMVAGKRYFGEGGDNKEAKRFRELIEEVFKLSGVSNPADFFPVYRWIDYKGLEKKMVNISEKMDAFLQNLIDEHRRDKTKDTMIGHLLSLQDSEPEYYTDTVIKGITMVMLLAGTDTSAVTIEWAMSSLLNHPEILKKARTEIDNVVGNDRIINESDVSRLPYLEKIVSETLRLFPAAPLLVPHESSDDCKIGGYDIPRRTILLVNAWAIHRDPSVWEDPMSFKPERFEAGEVGPPKLMPFGMGRRSCPGLGLAQRTVGLTLGSLIQCFEWQRVDEAMIDLTEGKGITMPKAIPLEAKCKARDEFHKLLHGTT